MAISSSVRYLRAYRNDTVAANIYGDVKQPELYFAATPDTKAAKLAKVRTSALLHSLKMTLLQRRKSI